MVGRTAPIKKHQRRRFEIIKEYCGCLCCLIKGFNDTHATIEHITESGRRVGKGSDQHNNSFGCCAWHHFGHPWPGRDKTWMAELVGPSLAHGRKPFEAAFGSEETLVKLQDYVLHLFEQQPWPEYHLSATAARQTRIKWIVLKNLP